MVFRTVTCGSGTRKHVAEVPPFPVLLERQRGEKRLDSEKMRLQSGEIDLYIFRFSKFL